MNGILTAENTETTGNGERRDSYREYREFTRIRPRFSCLSLWTLSVSVPLWFRSLLVPVAVLLAACGKQVPGTSDVPPGVALKPGVFEDVAPRWSHDGRRIAFLRHTTDRKYQLCIASADLHRVTPLLEPQYVSPDRPFRTSRIGYRSPDGLAWSPDDRVIVFPQVEWMTFPDGEKLPGMGLWSYDTVSRKAAPLAIHPKEYKGSLYFYRSPAWSPDGRHIAFVGEGLHGETALFVVPSSGRKAEIEIPRYDSFQDSGWPAWSPDGRKLAFRQGILRGYTADAVETIRVIEPGGTEGGRIWATTPDRYTDLAWRQAHGAAAGSRDDEGRAAPKVSGIAWSPDGSRVAFTVSRDPAKPLTAAIWILDGRQPGSVPRALTGGDPSNRTRCTALVWIDSTTLGAVELKEGGSSVRAVSLAVEPGAGAEPVITTLAELPSADLDWSADGRRIACAGGANTNPAAAPLTTLRVIRVR